MLYYEDLILKKILTTPLSDPITKKIIEDYVKLTGDGHNSHTTLEFNQKFGYNSLFIAGNLIIPLSEGLVYKNNLYHVFIIREINLEFKNPLYVDDKISIRDLIRNKKEVNSDKYGLVRILRMIKNQHERIIATGEVSYLIEKRSK